MPDDTQPGGQVPAGTPPPAGNAADQSNQQPSQPNTDANSQQPQPGASGGNGTTGNGKPALTLEEALAALERKDRDLADTRKEAANYRTKAKDLDKRIADDEAAKLSDVEKAQKRAEAAEAREKTTRERVGRTELKLAAKDAGIIDADDAIVHLLGKLEYDDDGEPQDVAKLVTDLKASKPHLFAAASSGASTQSQQAPRASTGAAMNAPRSSTQTGGLTRELIERMTPREYALRRADVMAWLAANPTR